MDIQIDEMNLIVTTEWLQRMFDRLEKSARRAKTPGDVQRVARMEGEYAGARDALATLGIRIDFDRDTKRPVRIAKREGARHGN